MKVFFSNMVGVIKFIKPNREMKLKNLVTILIIKQQNVSFLIYLNLRYFMKELSKN